jgi:type III restriction enzyme
MAAFVVGIACDGDGATELLSSGVAEISAGALRVGALEGPPSASSLPATRFITIRTPKNGQFPIGSLGSWEREVLDRELPHAVAWYRNPPRSEDALAVAYTDKKGVWRRLFPDLVFFDKIGGEVRPSIVDPHWHDLPDTLSKLRGLARYAEEHGGAFHRIEAISKVDATLRVLDLTEEHVRDAVQTASSAEDLYRGTAASNY